MERPPASTNHHQLLSRTEKLFCSFCNNFLPACFRPSYRRTTSSSPPLTRLLLQTPRCRCPVCTTPPPRAPPRPPTDPRPPSGPAATPARCAATSWPRPCRPSSCSWRPRDSAAPAEPRPPGTRPHTGGWGPGRGHVVVRGLSTAPRLEAVRQLVRGYGEEERVAQSGGSKRCVPVCCLQGVRIARTASTASTPASPSPSWTWT